MLRYSGSRCQPSCSMVRFFLDHRASAEPVRYCFYGDFKAALDASFIYCSGRSCSGDRPNSSAGSARRQPCAGCFRSGVYHSQHNLLFVQLPGGWCVCQSGSERWIRRSSRAAQPCQNCSALVSALHTCKLTVRAFLHFAMLSHLCERA